MQKSIIRDEDVGLVLGLLHRLPLPGSECHQMRYRRLSREHKFEKEIQHH